MYSLYRKLQLENCKYSIYTYRVDLWTIQGLRVPTPSIAKNLHNTFDFPKIQQLIVYCWPEALLIT